MTVDMEERWKEENFIVFNLQESDVYSIFFNLYFSLIKKYFCINR